MGYFNKQGDQTLGTRDPRSLTGKQLDLGTAEQDGSDAKKDRDVQCCTTGRHTNGMGGWHYADTGVPDGGVCKQRDKGNKDCRYRTTDKEI